MSEEHRNAVEREFRYALQALAAEAPDQIRVLSPGCVACELLNDYDLERQRYREAFGPWLSRRQSERIGQIDRAIGAIPEADLQCFDNDVLTRPSWGQVRAAAKDALLAFGWPPGLPSEFTEVAPSVWRRPP